jgi:hypothetical protein
MEHIIKTRYNIVFNDISLSLHQQLLRYMYRENDLLHSRIVLVFEMNTQKCICSMLFVVHTHVQCSRVKTNDV